MYVWISSPWTRIDSSNKIIIVVVVVGGASAAGVCKNLFRLRNKKNSELEFNWNKKSVADIGGNSFWPPHKRAVRAVVKIIIRLAALEIRRPSRCIAVA